MWKVLILKVKACIYRSRLRTSHYTYVWPLELLKTFEKEPLNVILSNSSRLGFTSGWLKLLLKIFGSTRYYCSKKLVHYISLIGSTRSSSSRLEIVVPNINLLDFTVWVDPFHVQVDSNFTAPKSNFYFFCSLFSCQPGQCMGWLEPYAKSKKYAKIDSLSTTVNLTLFIISYKSVYLINKHNLTLLSSLISIKHI